MSIKANLFLFHFKSSSLSLAVQILFPFTCRPNPLPFHLPFKSSSLSPAVQIHFPFTFRPNPLPFHLPSKSTSLSPSVQIKLSLLSFSSFPFSPSILFLLFLSFKGPTDVVSMGRVRVTTKS